MSTPPEKVTAAPDDIGFEATLPTVQH